MEEIDIRTFRLVVCIDVDADSMMSAYERVYGALSRLPHDFAWESSDEAYDNGEAVNEEIISAARLALLSRLCQPAGEKG